ncbi:MAG TPA: hypothetical protein VMV95_02700 [Bacillota bacterium]|nr:hypothetical protein [Bacillota bacterium]
MTEYTVRDVFNKLTDLLEEGKGNWKIEIETKEGVELKEEYKIAVRKGNKVYYPPWMKRTSNQRFAKENRQLKNEVRMWKETCEILADKELLKNINLSLISLKEKGGIPLAQL